MTTRESTGLENKGGTVGLGGHSDSFSRIVHSLLVSIFISLTLLSTHWPPAKFIFESQSSLGKVNEKVGHEFADLEGRLGLG